MNSTSETLPWSPEAEQAVLGCLLLDNYLIYRLVDVDLSPESFYNAAHGRIWSVTAGLIGTGKPADVITVAEALGDEASECGGLRYLQELSMSVASTSSVRGYAAIVSEKAQRRALIRAGDEVQALTRQAEPPAVVLDRAQSVLMALKRQDARSEPVGLADALTARSERWEELGKGEAPSGMRTRVPALDRCLGGGLQRGCVVVVAARPSVGKTSLAVQAGLNVAADGHRVLVLSQEMPRGALVDRIAANLGRVPLDSLIKGIGPDDDDTWGRIVEARERALALPFVIDDQPALSLLAIRAKAQAAKLRQGLDVLIVDYLQLCAPSDRKLSRHHQIEEISRGLKTLAKELDLCVVLLSQINRDVAKTNREPELSDLKESGAIEEDADTVLLLHPMGEPADGVQVVVGIVAKNRQGPKPRIPLRFEGAYQRWTESTADVSRQLPLPARGRQQAGTDL